MPLCLYCRKAPFGVEHVLSCLTIQLMRILTVGYRVVPVCLAIVCVCVCVRACVCVCVCVCVCGVSAEAQDAEDEHLHIHASSTPYIPCTTLHASGCVRVVPRAWSLPPPFRKVLSTASISVDLV